LLKIAYEKDNENVKLRFFSKNKMNTINVVSKIYNSKEKNKNNAKNVQLNNQWKMIMC